ncbi:MAG: alginate export family protein [Rhodanobacteraceae bacterium]|nr:alginate export family protein [Rhodanobacteraceae bacterium]
MLRRRLIVLALLLGGLAPVSTVQSAGNTAAAPAKPWTLNLRYRHESVDDDAFARSAQADTLRVRAALNHRFSPQWTAQVEAEGVVELGDRFNSGANGQTAYPLVPDARALELNQAWLDWASDEAGFRIGRQMLVLDNARFVGNVAWRQNMQTFDAAQWRWKPTKAMEVQALYLDRVHRVNGDEARDPLVRERRLHAPLLRVSHTLPGGSLVGYGYWLEDRDVATASTRTLGLRWSAGRSLGDNWKGGLVLERAQQVPWSKATGGSTAYMLIEPRLEYGPLLLKAGWERLGAGRARAFQTPLATLHAFNGWADKFLVTPVRGLRDTYLSAQRGFELGGRKSKFELAYHDFRADRGAADYGRELDASLGVNLMPGLDLLAKVADYRSDGFARDTRKLWMQLEWSR